MPEQRDQISGRRATDKVPAAVILAIEDAARSTRHEMRNEIGAAVAPVVGKLAALEATVAANTLLSTKEHTEVKAQLAAFREDMALLPDIANRVVNLEQVERSDNAVAEALGKFTEQVRQQTDRARHQTYALATLIVAVLGLALAAVTHH